MKRYLRMLAAGLALTLSGSLGAGNADVALDEVRGLIKAGKFADAASGARTLLARVEAESGADSAEAAGVLDLLAESLWRGGRAAEPETRALAERALAIKERALGPDHLELAKSLTNLGIVSKLAGDYAAARPLIERALAIREKALGPDNREVAGSLSNLGSLLRDMGEFSKARALHQRALATREKILGPDHLEVGSSLNNLAIVLTDLGDYAAARALYERTLGIFENALGPEHPTVAVTLDNLGVLLWHTGEFATARSVEERALAIREKTIGPEHPDVAKGLNNLALVVRDMGDYPEARRLDERALAIWEKALGLEHPYLAWGLNNLALILKETGDFAGARRLHERTLAIQEKALGPENIELAASLTNLAIVDYYLGDYAAARPLAERALAIQEKALGRDHPDVANTLEALANVLVATGDRAAARALVERAVVMRRTMLGRDHPTIANALSYLARLDAVEGDVTGALDAALEAERITREQLRLTSRALSERQALRYASVRYSGLDLALTVVVNGADGASRRRVLDAVARSRAVVFDEMAARHRAATADPGVAPLVEALSRAQSRLANLMVRGPGAQTAETYRGLVEEARNEKDRAERALASASAAFAREFSRARLGIEEIAASLPPRSALVDLVQYDRIDLSADYRPGGDPDVPSYLAFVLRAGEQNPSVVSLGPVEKIDSLVERWRKEVSGSTLEADPDMKVAEVAYRAVGAGLRKAVWDPLGASIGQSSRVFVVADGSLNLVSLAALPTDRGGYLVERGPLVHYVSTERDVVPSTETKAGAGILVLGSPAYDAKPASAAAGTRGVATVSPAASATNAPLKRTFRGEHSSCGEFESVRFAALPGSEREADEVARLWTRKMVKSATMELIGPAASEAAFKENGPGRRVLHLATHGFFLGGRCASGVDGTRSREVGVLQDPPPVVGENPLLLSGLALAGANQRALAGPEDEDGVLTAEEVAALDLSGVEWVVLSACDTGIGEYKAGEGMFGLRRAFQVAGARTVIMSLWSVEDEATRGWMRSLYQERLRGASTAEAIRNASLKMMESLERSGLPAHPYLWGGFVAVGDWK